MPDQVPVTQPSDEVDFAEFYEQEYSATVKLAAFLSGDRSLAEDLAQEAFSRLHSKFAGLEKPAAYVRTTLVNLCHNQRRSFGRELHGYTRHGASPTVVSDRAAELDATLNRLPYEERAVVVLRYWLRLLNTSVADPAP